MFYTPEASRKWEIASVYETERLKPLLDEMQKHEAAPGYSDVGIRNLIYTTVINLRPRRVLEIGTHIGVGSVIIAEALTRNEYGKLLTLEPSEIYRPIAQTFIAKGGYADCVEILPHRSTDPACRHRLVKEAPFEVVFIDAAHDYESASFDIALTATLLLDNGMAILHDVGSYSNEMDSTKRGGVRQALHDFVSTRPEYKAIYFEHPLWMNACGAAILCRQKLDPPLLS